MAPTPKPNATRPQRGAMVSLPAEGRSTPPPAMPDVGRPWRPETQRWWASVWASPAAVMWDERDPGLERMAILQEQLQAAAAGEELGAKVTVALYAELRQLEDRFGLNPQARARLRWTIDQPEPRPALQAVPEPRARRADPRLA